MTFVELLRQLVQKSPGFNDTMQREANALLDELETLNAFGTTLSQTASELHDFLPAQWPYSTPGNESCKYCGKPRKEHIQNV